MITWNEVLQIGDSVGVTDVGMATDFVGVGTMVAVVPEAGVEGGVVLWVFTKNANIAVEKTIFNMGPA